MITAASAFAMLEDGCPSFQGRALAAADYRAGIDAIAAFSEFGRHLVDLAEAGDAEELPRTFRTVELLLAEGDSETVSLVRTSLIEEIQNITSHRDVGVSPEQFRSVLGPLALEVWDELDESWTAATGAEHSSGIRPAVEDYLNLGPVDRRKVQAMTRELPDGTLARPSDVLRYEAGRYGDAVELRNLFIRNVLLFVLVSLLVIVAVGAIMVS